MKPQEREHLNYRPILGYKPDIGWLVKQVSTEELEKYQPSSEITDANSIMASDLLAAVGDTIKDNELLLTKLEDCLRQDNSGPMSFDNYLMAKEAGDYNKASQYEEYHHTSVDGQIQAEMYLALLDLQEDLESCTEHVKNTFFAGSGDSKDRLQEKEKASLGARIVQDIKDPGQTDKLALAVEAKLKYLAKERIENAQDFMNKAQGLLSTTTNDQFGGDIKKGIEKLAQAPAGGLAVIKDLAETKVVKLAFQGRAIKNRLSNVGNSTMRKEQSRCINKLKETRLGQVKMITPWFRELTLNDEAGTCNAIMDCVVDSISDIDSGLEQAIFEAMQTNQLDKMNRDDLVDNLTQKKATRQVYKLASDMQKHFDSQDPDRTRQIKRFVDNFNLDKPGNECTM